MKPNVKRDINLDFLRCIACIAVVVIHSLPQFWYSTPVTLEIVSEYEAGGGILPYREVSWYVCSVIDALARFSVPVFVMLSGALLTEKELSIPYLYKKICHFVVLILFWGVVYQIYFVGKALLLGENINIMEVLRGIVLGPGAFWFFFMLIPLYIASPVFQYITNKKDILQIYLICWLLMTVVFKSIVPFIPGLDHLGKTADCNIFSVYSGYFLLGAYYRKYGLIPKLERAVIIVGCVSLVLMAFGTPEGYFHNFTTIFCVLFSFTVFILGHKVVKGEINSKINHLITVFSGYTMGIYALHGLALTILQDIWKPCVKYWILQIIFYVLVSVIVSVLGVYIIKKIKILRNMV